MKNHFTLLLLFIGLSLLPSCIKFDLAGEDLDDKWDPGFAIPLLDVDLSLQNALNRFETGGFVTTDPDNLVIAVYQSQKFSISGGDFFSLPDFVVPQVNNPQDNPAPFPSPQEFRNITLKEGRLIYNASSLETQSVTVTFGVPDLTFGGTGYSKTYSIPASDGSTPQMISDTVDIAEFNLSFAGGDFRTEYTATSGGQNVTLTSSFGMVDLKYSYIDGYFGNQAFSLPAGINTIDLFSNWTQGNIIFEDPTFSFNFTSSYGFPIRIAVDSLSATTNFAGVVNLESPTLANGIDLAFPSLAEAGQSKTTSIVLDKNNSNINNLISNIPYEFYYSIPGSIIPDANTSIDNFLTDSSQVQVDVNVEFPMYCSAGQFVLEDTFDFNFDEYRDLDRMGFKVITDNGFPFEVGFQTYFLDENNVVVDSLFSNNTPVLASAPVDGNGQVTTSVISENETLFDETRFSNLKEFGKRAVIIGSIQTTNGGNTPVKIFSDYRVRIQMGAIIGF